MDENRIHNLLIYAAVFTKIIYIIIAILDKLSNYFDWDNKDTFNKLKEYGLTITDVFMYLIILFIFSPHKAPVKIKVNREEQIILFSLGILGLIHSNWNSFIDFLKTLKLLNN